MTLERAAFAGPFRAFDEREMQSFRVELEKRVFSCDGPDPRSRYQSRHLDSGEVMRVCCNPAITSRVQAVLGESAVLWRSNFFPKPPGAGEFDWHTDRSHWKDLLDPMINVTAWLAIDPATAEAGCLQFTVHTPDDAVPLDMTLKPGEFVLFDQDTLHRSGPNGTDKSRLGLAMRYTLANVRIKKDERLPAMHRVIPLREPNA